MRLLRFLKRDLAREASLWAQDGIISDEQAAQICQRYGIDIKEQQSQSYGYYVLLVLGYLFIGLSLIVLIGANWEDIPRALRMGGLISVTVAINLLGVWRYRQGDERAAIGWFFLGGLSYGAAIMLIAQIYHLGEHYPDGIFWWILGVLPAALLLRSSILMLLASVLMFTWFFVEIDLHYYPAFFPLFLAALGWHVMKVKHSNFLFLVLVIGLGLLFEYSLAWSPRGTYWFDFEIEHVLLIGALFVLYFGLSKWLAQQNNPSYQDYGVLLNIWCLRFAILILLLFSFEWPWEEFMQINPPQKSSPLLILAPVMCALAVLMSYLASRVFKETLSTLAFSAVYLISVAAVLYLPQKYAGMMQIFTNLVLVGTGIWLIAQGVRHAVSHYFYLGVLSIMLTALLRYFDLVGDYVSASMLFAVFAALMIGVARFWRNTVKKAHAEALP